MDYSLGDGVGLVCQGTDGKNVKCGKLKTADGGPLLRCKCAKIRYSAAVYCSQACQKVNWPSHKPHCQDEMSRAESLSPEELAADRVLSNFYHHNFVEICDMGISALDLVNCPENADVLQLDIFLSCHKDPKTRSGLTVRVDDLKVVKMPELQDWARREIMKVLKPASPSGVVLVCVGKAIMPDEGILAKARRPAQTLPYALQGFQLHVQHSRGMPIVNWKEFHTAKLNGSKSVPNKITLATLPTRYISSLVDSLPAYQRGLAAYKKDVLAWVRQYGPHLNEAARSAALVEGKAIEDNAILVYVYKNPKAKGSLDRYIAVSAVCFSKKDLLAIHFNREQDLFDGWMQKRKDITSKTAAKLPLVLINLVGTGYWEAPLLELSDDPQPVCPPRKQEYREAPEWKQNLLKVLGNPNRKFVNEPFISSWP